MTSKNERTRLMPLKRKTREVGQSTSVVEFDEDANAVEIPKSKRKPSPNLMDYNIMIYGDSGVGKTCLAAEFPDCLVLQTEPERKGLEIWSLPVPYIGVEMYGKTPRRPFVQAGNALEKAMEDDSVKTVAIDTFNLFWQSAQDHVCFTKGVTHPQEIENDWGKSWREIRESVRNTILLFKESGKTLLFLDHSSLVETVVGGVTYMRTTPNLSDSKNGGLQVIKEMTDLIVFYGVDEHGKRFFQIDNTMHIFAKCAIDDHFLTPKGEKLHKFYAGDTPAEAYQTLVNAFHNEVNNIQETSLKRKG